MSIKPGTGLPWHHRRADRRAGRRDRDVIEADGGEVVFDVHLEDDARYIVHAANSFPELIEALESVVPPAHMGESEQSKAFWAKARATLAKAMMGGEGA